jgi:hypothetical protein
VPAGKETGVPVSERKVVRNELARINRTRLERMLGPDGGYDNW